jgi:hypothetical protein
VVQQGEILVKGDEVGEGPAEAGRRRWGREPSGWTGARWIGMDRGAMDRDGQGRDESRPYEDESRPPPRMSRSAKGKAIHRDGRGREPPRSDGLGEASRRGRPDERQLQAILLLLLR